MATYATIWTNVAGLTYQQAKAAASAKGGVLITDVGGMYGSKIEQWASDGLTPSDNNRYNPVWVGAERGTDDWRWSDGSVIEKSRFVYDDVNADDDPSNDSQEVIAYGGQLYSFDPSRPWPGPGQTLQEVSTGYIMDYLTANVVGSDKADWVVDVRANVTSMKLLGGDDRMFARANIKNLDLGAGNDDVIIDNFDSGAYSTVVDGEGSDQVTVALGEIRASPDGDNDYYYAPKVSYDSATVDIVVSRGTASSSEIGYDYVDTQNLTLGSGNDTAAGYNIINGGRGDDTLTPMKRAEGGRGNDTLIAEYVPETGRVKLLGQEGDDTFVIRANAELTGGAGSDLYIFESVGKTTINDLMSGDRIDLSTLLGDLSPTEARNEGFFSSSVSNGYTYGYIDLDGGGDNFVEVFALKGVIDPYGYLI